MVVTDNHRTQIKRFFKELAKKYPNSPIYLFSSIADGADRFVANIFLDLKKENNELAARFELIVPIPFNVEEYKKDFDDVSCREFDSLIKKAKRSFCITCSSDMHDRPEKYLKAGKFVADSSIILIALWDGEKGKRGGTADIVQHKITGDNENASESTFEYDGSVFILPCMRNNSGAQKGPVSDEELSLDIVLKDAAIKEALEKIEEINYESTRVSCDLLSRSGSGICNKPKSLDPPQKSILNWYSFLDMSSLKFRERDNLITINLFSLGFLLIIALEIYSNIFLTNLVLGISMFLALLATIIYLYSRSSNNHKKYLYNRLLAEALRIQFYWNMAGISRNVSDYILKIHRQDLTWIKYIMSAVFGVTYNNKVIDRETIKDLIDNWIKNQASFFEAAIRKMNRRLGLLQKVSNISFLTGLGLLLSIFFLGDYYKGHGMLNLLLVIIGSALGLFALIKGYVQMKSYQQLLNQYELMHVIYKRAESKINETDTYDFNQDQKNAYLKDLFFVIGKEALIESGNWYLIFKGKEPEIEGI